MKPHYPLFFIFLFGTIIQTQAQQTGVTVYDTAQVSQGVNMFSSGDERTVYVDMEGKTIYKSPIGLIEMLPDGNMIGLAADTILIKFDSDMNIIWKTSTWGHHDISVGQNGWIYLLSGHVHPFMGKGVKYETVLVYSAEGKLMYTWCLYDHMQEFMAMASKSPWLNDLPKPYEKCASLEEFIAQDPERFFIPTGDTGSYCSYEISHFNSLNVVQDNPYYKTNPAFKNGNVLVSFNPYSSYGIIDMEAGKLEWVGYLKERSTLHSAKFTPNGNILVFENATDRRIWGDDPERESWLKALPPQKGTWQGYAQAKPWASVSEYNPITGERVWDYAATSRDINILAKFSGSAQRLPNGNTLICVTTDAQGGRAFEVTPQKKIVWEYLSPDKDQSTGLPWSYYRTKRISFDMARKMIPNF